MPEDTTHILSGLIPCPHCGSQVNSRARTCPECGAALHRKKAHTGKKIPRWLLIVGLIVMIGCEAVSIKALIVARRVQKATKAADEAMKQSQ